MGSELRFEEDILEGEEGGSFGFRCGGSGHTLKREDIPDTDGGAKDGNGMGDEEKIVREEQKGEEKR